MPTKQQAMPTKERALDAPSPGRVAVPEAEETTTAAERTPGTQASPTMAPLAVGPDEDESKQPPRKAWSAEHLAGLTLLALALLEPPEVYACEHRDALRALAYLGLRRCYRETHGDEDASESTDQSPSAAHETSEAAPES